MATDAHKSPLSGCLSLFLGLAAGWSSLPATGATNELLTQIVMVRVGGIKVPGPWTTNTTGAMSLRLPKPARLEISFGPVEAAVNQPLRIMRKMEGVDADWEEGGGQMQRAHMQLMVMVHDDAKRLLSHQRFTLTGKSEGWRGSLETSEFRLRREAIDLPTGASRLQVLLTAENWTVLGCAAITDFRVLVEDANGHEENIWPDPHLEEGDDLDQPEGTPRYWQRGGFGNRMAQVLKLSPPAQGHALVIRDDDVRMSATWRAEVPLPKRARVGDTLNMSWREAFSIGIGERSRATFDPLPPGKYVFRVKSVSPFGEPIGSELALNILIPQPLWKRPEFVLPIVLASAVLLGMIVWVFARRRLQARLTKLEHRRQMEHERLRIAQDIHDDLGASLTQISLLSQTAHEKVSDHNPAWHDTERLRAMAVRLTQQLDEIVWAVNPQHDTLESLMSYLTDFAEEFLAAAGTRARIQIPVELPGWILPSSLRHNVFLAAKEALNNAVKHAQATEVRLLLVIHNHAFELTIEDNGCGFSPPSLATSGMNPADRRHGLSGMKQRMESIGGELRLETAFGRGTRVTFAVPVKTPVV